MTRDLPVSPTPGEPHACYDEHQPGCDCVIPAQTIQSPPSYLDRLVSAEPDRAEVGEGEQCRSCFGRGRIYKNGVRAYDCPGCGGAGRHPRVALPPTPAKENGDTEAVAKLVYEAMTWAAQHAETGKVPAWVAGGNALAQNCARGLVPRIKVVLKAPPTPAVEGEGLLWAMHIRGPDDLYPAPDYETAVKWCDYINYSVAPRAPDVMLAAVPAVWPYSDLQHASSLEGAVAEWSLPPNPDGTEQVITPLHPQQQGAVEVARKALEKIVAEVDDVGRKALEFYAGDHANPNEGPWGVNSNDFGSVAREALALLNKGAV